jgi:ribosome biogenesis GTPase A
MGAAEEILMAEAIAKKADEKLQRKEKFKTGSLTPDKKDRKEKREQDRREMSAKMKADNAKKKR